MMIFNGLVFQYNHLCDVSEFSNWRLYKFFNKTVKLTTGFKNWISTHDFLMDELSSKRSQKSPRNIPIRVNIVAQFYITGVSFLAGTGMTTGGISTRGIFVNRDYIRWYQNSLIHHPKTHFYKSIRMTRKCFRNYHLSDMIGLGIR